MRKIYRQVGSTMTLTMCLSAFLSTSANNVFCASDSEKITLTKRNLEFTLQENLDPWALANCDHEPENNPVDWLVTCKLDQTKHVFRVHLVIQRYKKTRYGQSAHEILYWVTDATHPRSPAHASSTIWLHHRQPEVETNVLEMAQGVDNDLKSLRLKVLL